MTTIDAGFAIHTDHEDVIDDNARGLIDPHYGDPELAAEWIRKGLVRDGNQREVITAAGWELLSKDVSTLERNSLAWLRKKFPTVRVEGHDSYSDLIGTLWFDPKKVSHAEIISLGIEGNERIDMTDSSYGDLANSVWKGVSRFGQAVLGGHITFFAVDKGALEVAEETAYKAMKRRQARKARK